MATDTEDKGHLLRMCQSIAEELTRGPTREWAVEHGLAEEREEADDEEDEDEDEELPTGWDYLTNGVYDVEFIVSRDGTYKGARLMVAGGGPNIWVNTKTEEVEGYWWGEEVRVSYRDGWDLDSALEDEWSAR